MGSVSGSIDPARVSGGGFQHPAYASALTEWGSVRRLEASGAWLLVRPIPDSTAVDAMAGYRYLICDDWGRLADDLAGQEGIASVVAVTDPVGDFDEADLDRAFPDLRRPYKASFVVDLLDPRPAAHHLARARKAARTVSISVDDAPLDAVDDFERLYVALRDRFQLAGMEAFSRASFAAQLATPGCVAVRAFDGDVCVSMSMYFVVGDIVYSHLVASDEQGYKTAASYLVHEAAIEAFAAAGLRWLDLGSGAGVEADPTDGLSNFKRGWSSETRQTYLCGRVVDAEAYERLALERGDAGSGFFPAYRTGSD